MQLKARHQVHTDKIDDMLFKFESAERRIEHLEAESESLELGRRNATGEALAKLADEDKVADELAALKARLAKRCQPATPAKE